MKTNILSLLLLISCTISIGAQGTWQHIEGMPCEETSSIVQDSNGYIWIGTRLGLVRYDGYNMQIYRNDMTHPHAFSSCNIVCLATDRAERIFAGAFFGLNTLCMTTHNITSEHFEGEDHVHAVCYDKSGNLWIGTDNGLYRQMPKEGKSYFKFVPHDVILHLHENSEGKIVVVSQNSGMFLVDGNDNCTPLSGTVEIRPRVSFTDADGTLWIGTERQGLYALRHGQFTKYGEYDDCTINDIVADARYNSLLLATDRGLVQYPATNTALEGCNVRQLYRDKDNNVWASTEGQGIYIRRNYKMPFNTVQRAFTRQTTPIMSQFEVRSLSDTLLWKDIHYINAVYEGNDGRTFIGTWNDGLYVTENGSIVRHLTPSDTPWLNTNSIYAMCTLPDGNTIISTWYSFYLMHKNFQGRYIPRVGRSDVSSMHILSLYSRASNDVWMGLVGGIAHIEGNLEQAEKATITIYTHVNKQGVHAPDNVGRLTDSHDETGEYQLGGIYRIVEDRHGRIWACTSEPGLLLYDRDSDSFRSVSAEMGIPGDNVHSMDIDANGDFWMTTNYGIMRITTDEMGKTDKQQLYTQYDGLPGSYYGSTMSTRLADGTICFLNQDNMITFMQAELLPIRSIGHAFISEVLVNGTPLEIHDKYVAALPPYTDHITLRHDQNNLSVYFTTLSYGQEHSIRYTYQLEGIDKDFRQTDIGTNSVSYTQLPPGTYTLRYSASDAASEPGGEMLALTIEIMQPLWWRWWAKTLYIIVLLLLAYIIIHSVTDRNRKQQQLRILEIEKRQIDELYKKKTQFYVKVLHEFLTPLTLMNEMIHDLHNKVRPSLQASLFMLSNHSDRLMDSLKDIVNAREDEAAREALHKAKEMTLTDSEFLRRCTNSVNQHISDSDYSHQTMMQEVGASHATLYRKLKTLTGMDTTSFIRSIRMRAACQILTQEPGIRIAELAERVGYSNPKYFSSCFKTEFGMTPTEYQQQGGEE